MQGIRISVAIVADGVHGLIDPAVASSAEQQRVRLGNGDAPGLVQAATDADRAGVDTAWLAIGGPAPDPFAVFAAAADSAPRVNFGTAIIPTFPRHPLALVQGALALDQLVPGRFRLGVGPSHKPAMEDTWGLSFDRPLTHLREYLTILRDILSTGRVDFDGEMLHAHAELPAPTQVEVVASALRPRAFRLLGELADGVLTNMCPPQYLRDTAVPAIAEGAKRAGRTPPPLIAKIPIVVCEDRDLVRATARRQIGFYQRLPFYRQMQIDAGFADAETDTFTDTMSDALVISGSEDEVAERIASLRDFGVDEVYAAILRVGDNPDPTTHRTVELLGALNQTE